MRSWLLAAVAMAACGDNGNAPVDAIPGTDVSCVTSVTAIPAQLDLGSQRLAQTSTGTVVLANTGTCSTRPLALATAGANASELSIASSSCEGTVLAPGAACTTVVSFTPTTVGAKAARLLVDGADAQTVVTITATGVTVSTWTIAPGTLSFPTTGVSGTSAPLRFTVTNIGTLTSTSSIGVSLGGSNPTQFRVSAETCTAAVLTPGGSCYLDVVFEPTTVGSKAASLELQDPTLGSLTGSMMGTALSGTGVLTASPSTIDFGPLAAPSSVQLVTVTNNTGATTGVLASSLSGANAASYAIANDTCAGATLTPAGTCTFEVRTTCTGAGVVANATANVSGTPGGTATVNITGKVAGKSCTSVLAVTPTVKNFGAQAITTTSAAQRFTFTNFGGQTSAALMAQLNGSDPTQFVISNDMCTGVLLAPNSSCTVDVAFAPITSSGMKTALLHVDSTGSAALSGNAVPPFLLFLTPATHDFGTVANATKTFTVMNPGGVTTGPITTAITGVDLHRFELINDTCRGTALAPGAMCTLDVRTTCSAPFSTGTVERASLDLAASPGGAVQATLAAEVDGTGCPSPPTSPPRPGVR